jgi:hypothetical protein
VHGAHRKTKYARDTNRIRDQLATIFGPIRRITEDKPNQESLVESVSSGLA